MEKSMYKNLLQIYTQKSSVPIPVYQTINEGSSQMTKFRSTVYVDGASYKSPNTFSKVKEAEQDVAKMAFEIISRKPKEGSFSFLFQDTSLCKSIMNEYAVKMKLEKPYYDTKQAQGLIPIFVSDLVLNGVTFTGQIAKNKKEAEQFAARAAILSIMDFESKMPMFEIMKSKEKLYALSHGDGVNQNGVGDNVADTGDNHIGLEISLSKTKEHAFPEDVTTFSSFNVGSGVVAQPFHQFEKQKGDSSSKAITYPMTFIHPGHIPSVEFVPCSSLGKKKSHKKKSQIVVGGDTRFCDAGASILEPSS